jgi:hypothetical protein
VPGSTELEFTGTGQGLTPAVVEILKPLKKLRTVHFVNSGLTPGDVPAMKKVLPDCRIIIDHQG